MSVLARQDPESIETPSNRKPADELSDAPLEGMGKPAREFKLGNLTLDGRVFLAPMAGYTDTAFRRLARRYGAAMVVTEMVSSRALIAGSDKTRELMEFTDPERPVGVQLFGGDPAIMGEAAARVEGDIHPDVIDINFGCPVGKILKCDSGAAVLKEPQRAGWIVEAMVKSTGGRVPITVKTRAGFGAQDESVRIAPLGGGGRGLGPGGPRPDPRPDVRGQGQLGHHYPAEAEGPHPYHRERGCQIGRGRLEAFPADRLRRHHDRPGSMGSPWIFEEINHYLETGKPMKILSLKYKMGVALEQLKCSIEVKGSRMGLLEMRKHLSHYLKGFVGARDLRQKLLTSDDAEWVIKSLEELHRTLPETDPVPLAV